MATQLAWIRSKNAADVMALLGERVTECAAREVPETATCDGDTAPPARARARTGAAAAAAAPAANGGAGFGVPMLPGLCEEAEHKSAGQPAPAPPDQGAAMGAAPGQAEAATNGVPPAGAPAAAVAGLVAPGLPPVPPQMMMPLPFNPMMAPENISVGWHLGCRGAASGAVGIRNAERQSDGDDESGGDGDDAACARTNRRT